MKISKFGEVMKGQQLAPLSGGKIHKKESINEPSDGFTKAPAGGNEDIKALKLAAEKMEKKTEAPKDPIMNALELRRNLKNLEGPEKAKFIEDFKKKNAGKIYVSIDLHDHQPIYRPGVHPADTPEIQRYVLGTGDATNRREVYKDAEAYAIEAMEGKQDEYPHFGFQVSFSGSLMENMEKTKERGLWPGEGWNDRYKNLRERTDTSMGNERLDFVNIGYHHPLMGLIASGHDDGGVNHDKDIEIQIKMHQQAMQELFGGPISEGFFPPEMAFSERMIPAINKVGINWTMVDNLHFDRANEDYNNPQDGLKPPNKADQRNPGEHNYETLPNDLAKQHNVSPEGLRPHYTKFVDPVTGNEELQIIVPEERSLSSYIQKDRSAEKIGIVLEKFQKYNTDPEHPLFVLFATDGDNNGSNGGEFHRNVPIDMATRFPGEVVFTTVQDYLEMFPPEKPKLVSNENGVKKYEGGDVIHVEDGSWWGANLGDPQYSKWVDDPAYLGYSPKNNSWAVLTAAKNEVLTADSLEPAGNTPESISNITDIKGSNTEKAWGNLLVGQTSCYEYWNPDNVLSYSSVRGANMAMEEAEKVVERHEGKEQVGPSIFLPAHYPYNPSGYPPNFNVRTYVHDISGLKSVKVKYRIDDSGKVDTPEDMRFEGEGVKKWEGSIDMTKHEFPELENKPDVWVEPKKRAEEYRANVELNVPEDKPGAMVQYYVEAEDLKGNISKSPIQHVYVSTKNEPSQVSNEELHNQMKSGDPHTIGNAIAFIFTTGRNDVNIFNHAFFRIDEADDKLMDVLETLAIKEKIKLSDEPKFRDEYINRLDKHLEKEENVTKLKEKPHLTFFMSNPLTNQLEDPRVQRILRKLL